MPACPSSSFLELTVFRLRPWPRVVSGQALDTHPHDVLIGGQQLVADLKGRFESQTGLLTGEHDLGDIGHLAALVSLAK